MPYQTIVACANAAPFQSEAAAQAFLSSISPEAQAQVISAMYIGRNHLHLDQFSDDDAPYVSPAGLIKYCDHIEPKEFARILCEKGQSTQTYLQRFILCAKNDRIM